MPPALATATSYAPGRGCARDRDHAARGTGASATATASSAFAEADANSAGRRPIASTRNPAPMTPIGATRVNAAICVANTRARSSGGVRSCLTSFVQQGDRRDRRRAEQVGDDARATAADPVRDGSTEDRTERERQGGEKAAIPVLAALPVVSSTNQGTATVARTFPASETVLAATRARRGGAPRVSADMDAAYPGLVVAIFGPTASGKSEVAEALAARLPSELVSADAMQVYRGLPILTNQSPHPTRLVAIWPLSHDASVGEYQRLAHAAIDEIVAEGKAPIVVGGTGLYLRAALAELELPRAPRVGARERWERLYDRLGPDDAHRALAERDAEAAARVHPNDRRRVVRALELAAEGLSLVPGRDRLWAEETRYPTLIVGLDVRREELSRRIEERTRRMFTRGVEEEVLRALSGPISDTARHIHGLREVAELPRQQAIEALVVRTRRYAAYQRKWMRRVPGVVTVRADRPPDEVADEILEVARARERLPARRAG